MLPVRRARPDDLSSVQKIVDEAYAPYIARIGREPGPMLDEYAARIAAGEVEVVDGPGGLDAILVLVPARAEGREVLAVFEAARPDEPAYIIWLTWRDGRIVRIRDTRYVRYVMEAVVLDSAPAARSPRDDQDL